MEVSKQRSDAVSFSGFEVWPITFSMALKNTPKNKTKQTKNKQNQHDGSWKL